MSLNSPTKAFFVLLAVFMLAGCSSILPKGAPAARQYTLNAPIVMENSGQRLPVNLQIIQPQATPGLDSDRIILRRDDNRIDYYADAKWTGNLNTVVQSLLVESFDRSHAFQSVGSDLVAMNPDIRLLVEIRDFQSEYIGGTSEPRAHIRLVAKLLRPDGTMVLTHAYEEKEAAANNDLGSIIHAFDTAQQNAIKKLVADTKTALAQQPVSKKKKN